MGRRDRKGDQLRRKAIAILIAVASFAVALPLSLLGLRSGSAAGGLLFGLPLIGATAASYLAWLKATAVIYVGD
jgi:hypothetical protein